MAYRGLGPPPAFSVNMLTAKTVDLAQMRAASAREGPMRDVRLRATLACARVMLRLCAVVALVLSAQQLRQLGDIGRDAPRLVANDPDMKMRLTTLRPF